MTRTTRLLLLSALYLSQGLPFGFFTLALPVVLRERGVDLATIGASSALLLPWGFKFLWGPVIDRFGSRKAWIVPLQLSTVAVLIGLSQVDPLAQVEALAVGMFLASLLASTQDVATDALAVSLLPLEERGLGNGIQVGAYRLGMIVGGSAILYLYARVGPSVAFGVMALLLALATVPIVLATEPPRHDTGERVGLRQVLAAARQPGIGPWLLVLCLYKAGDAAASPMVKPLLFDAGWTLEGLGGLMGMGGSVAGLVGAMVGGVLTGHLGRRRAMVTFGLIQAVAIGAYVVPAALGAGLVGSGVAVLGEHVTSGMATAALFTRMMDRCRPGLEATDYTLQASVVVLATGAVGALSGIVAESVGYPVFFGGCASLALLGAVAASVQPDE